MFKYFNVDPLSSSSFTASFPRVHSLDRALPFNRTAIEYYTSQSQKVKQSILEDKPVNNGMQIMPQYDTDETIDSASPNPFTNPRMGELDRFEYAQNLGADARQAAELSSHEEPTGFSTVQTSSTGEADSSDGQ